MTHGVNAHETASYLVQTGRQPGRLVYPCAGAVVAQFKGYDNGYEGIAPPYIVLTEPQGRFSEAGFLGQRYKPFATGGDPNQKRFAVEGIVAPGYRTSASASAASCSTASTHSAAPSPTTPNSTRLDECEESAYALMFGDARKLFDLSAESDDLRERYGRNTFGQSCLMARRLVESGVPYVTINYKGWDTHKQHFQIMQRKLPELDQGFATLLQDLSDRGLLDARSSGGAASSAARHASSGNLPGTAAAVTTAIASAPSSPEAGSREGRSSAPRPPAARPPSAPRLSARPDRQHLRAARHRPRRPTAQSPRSRRHRAAGRRRGCAQRRPPAGDYVMSRIAGAAILLALLVALPEAPAQNTVRAPQLGYLYPAGGERGTKFYVTAGGQFLRRAEAAYVSGAGVHVTVVEDFPPLRGIDAEQRAALAARFAEVFQQRWQEALDDGVVTQNVPWGLLRELGMRRAPPPRAADAEPIELPRHPLLHDLEHKSIRELLHIVHTLRSSIRGQRNPQLETTVLLEVQIDRDAEPGQRELRLQTRLGLTNPLAFEIDVLDETCELEDGEGRIADFLPDPPPLELPILINGQILPGDVDRFRFTAKKDQQLVIETRARRLIPFLADAVPGWFQATLTLFDADGNAVAFVDDYRFSPDPVLRYVVPADGVYALEVRDAIYRGREDFVYRISVGENRFVTSIFPLGCRSGQRRYVTADGWNLASTRFFVDGKTDPTVGIREKSLGRGRGASNPVAYDVSTLRAQREAEDNDTPGSAQPLRTPGIIDGRIDYAGDLDLYSFTGDAGDDVVIEIIARRARSPLDALVRLLDEAGNVVAWNDDRAHKEGYLHTDMGVLTHHADSYLRTRLPADGTYFVQVTDAQSQGGLAYAYRLRVGPPQPDFELRVTPSSVNLRTGFAAPLHVYALRKDGFAGDIELRLVDAPPGLTLDGARIPAGRDSVRMTLSTTARGGGDPFPLRVDGRAMIAGNVVTHAALPADDLMQAFLWRHLTPAQDLLVVVQGGRRFGGLLRLADPTPIRIPAGGVQHVHIDAPQHPRLAELRLQLNEPPAGIILRDVSLDARGFSLELTADPDVAAVGLADNLIVEALLKVVHDRGPRAGQTSEVLLGVLPAMPFEVVGR
jgi:hypothetical protein